MRLSNLAFFMLVTVLSALTGCSGSGNGAGSDPFTPAATTTNNGGTVFGNISTVTGKTGISLSTDVVTVDVNNGQVLATAKLISNGTAVSGVPVTFSIEAPTNGPATIEAGMATVATDSNGSAVTRITTGYNVITTNVIVKAEARIANQLFASHATFQIVRGGGVIMFTDKAGLAPGQQSDLLPGLSVTVDPLFTGGTWDLEELIPVKLTDSNGNPRVGVTITLSAFIITSLNPGDATADFIVEPGVTAPQQTIVTDSAGQGVFNAVAHLKVPAAGTTNTSDIVFKAVTNDASQIIAYAGAPYSVTTKTKSDIAPTPAALSVTPTTALFGSSTDVAIGIAGGTRPYTVDSSKLNLATVTMTGSVMAVAHLVDNSAWTDVVVITVTDAAGQAVSTSIKR
jgi:hypothetical protein